MRIAVPVVQGRLCMHFGHCETFALVDVDPDQRVVVGRRDLVPPPHEPGVLPRWLAEQNATVIIAGGMGQRAQQLFSQQGIEVVVGAQAASPEALVEQYLSDTLETGANACSH